MEEEVKAGAPAWMVSFGDMMTLILTFFILLVSMSRERQVGLIAKGVGSFVVAVRSHGLDGTMQASEKFAIFDEIRARFNLPPEDNPERRTDHAEASDRELVRATLADGLRPHDELNQPTVAVFDAGSHELSDAARDYINILAPTLKPGRGQVLVLEGHAADAADDRAGGFGAQLLAFRRAKAVRTYLVEEWGFLPERVEARAWVVEVDSESTGTRGVDARLITPVEEDD